MRALEAAYQAGDEEALRSVERAAIETGVLTPSPSIDKNDPEALRAMLAASDAQINEGAKGLVGAESSIIRLLEATRRIKQLKRRPLPPDLRLALKSIEDLADVMNDSLSVVAEIILKLRLWSARFYRELDTPGVVIASAAEMERAIADCWQ